MSSSLYSIRLQKLNAIRSQKFFPGKTYCSCCNNVIHIDYDSYFWEPNNILIFCSKQCLETFASRRINGEGNE